jgi:hypothetical protein
MNPDELLEAMLAPAIDDCFWNRDGFLAFATNAGVWGSNAGKT